MPRFFMENPVGNPLFVEGNDARHIALSLRMKVGDTVTVCDGKGMEYTCEITALSPERVELSVNDTHPTKAEPSLSVTLYQGLPKGEKLEWIIQKGVELGVSRIVPVVTSRSIAKMSDRDQKKVARWQKIANEAAGQSGRGMLPTVESPVSFKEAALRMAKEHTVVFYECGGKPLTALAPAFTDTLSVFVGPEGGIAPEELQTLTENGAKVATLGPRILRCETAPLAALAAIFTLSGDME